MLLKCDCYQRVQDPKSSGQDKLYGKGVRVHNYPCKSKTTGRYTAARCTVCGTTKEVG